MANQVSTGSNDQKGQSGEQAQGFEKQRASQPGRERAIRLRGSTMPSILGPSLWGGSPLPRSCGG